MHSDVRRLPERHTRLDVTVLQGSVRFRTVGSRAWPHRILAGRGHRPPAVRHGSTAPEAGNPVCKYLRQHTRGCGSRHRHADSQLRRDADMRISLGRAQRAAAAPDNGAGQRLVP